MKLAATPLAACLVPLLAGQARAQCTRPKELEEAKLDEYREWKLDHAPGCQSGCDRNEPCAEARAQWEKKQREVREQLAKHKREGCYECRRALCPEGGALHADWIDYLAAARRRHLDEHKGCRFRETGKCEDLERAEKIWNDQRREAEFEHEKKCNECRRPVGWSSCRDWELYEQSTVASLESNLREHARAQKCPHCLRGWKEIEEKGEWFLAELRRALRRMGEDVQVPPIPCPTIEDMTRRLFETIRAAWKDHLDKCTECGRKDPEPPEIRHDPPQEEEEKKPRKHPKSGGK